MFELTEEVKKDLLRTDTNLFGHKRFEYQKRRMKIIYGFYEEYGEKDIISLFKRLYETPMSFGEIQELIKVKTGETMTAKSIERTVKRDPGYKTRPIQEAFRLAIKKGRVKWALVEGEKKIKGKQLSPKLRMEILKRDEFKCKLCGNVDFLEIDHIVPRCKGGSDKPENLRVLCHECNVGKRLSEGEGGVGGGFVSGK